MILTMYKYKTNPIPVLYLPSLGHTGLNNYFLIICLVSLFCAAPSNSTPVHWLNYGILFELSTKLYLGQEYWTHTFQIPLPKKVYLHKELMCNSPHCKYGQHILNKRPMGHIAHLRKQLKSINTSDYIIMLIKRRKNNIINFMRIYCFFIWRNLNPPHPRMLCAKIGWNWLSSSGEEDFLISSLLFYYFVIISPWKRVGPFICTILNPLHHRMHCDKFGWNWLSGSGKEDFKNFVNVFWLFRHYLPLNLESSFIQGCFVPSLV